MPQKGIVFDIQRFTIHDGPGLRTELFFKGCPLRCKWCSNPESQKRQIEWGVYKTKCISKGKCNMCTQECKDKQTVTFTRGKLTALDNNKSEDCLASYNVCPSDAIKQWGKEMTVEECMQEIRKDRGYYERSGGGVSISGGDPIMQSDFAASLLKACKAENIHTCFESAFYAEWQEVEKVLPYADLIITDLKHMDTEIHKKYTGVGNEKILENIKKIVGENKELIIRVPVIPNVNDDRENIEETADFIINELEGKVKVLQLLSFMRLGEEKYTALNRPYEMADMKVNRRSFQKHVEQLAQYFSSRGIHCLVGTKERQ